MVHQKAGDYESAEAAYRRSLEIETQNNNLAGQADSLTMLGNLYDNLNRLEEAVIFYRQAADIYIELGHSQAEALTRNNIAGTLQKIRRYDDARIEIKRAIELGWAEPWKSYAILRQIEEATGDPTAARAAWVQARDAYLAYRRQGGYASQGAGGQFIDQVLGLIQQKKAGEIQKLFDQYSDAPDFFKMFMQIVVDILNGSRDKTLADNSELQYTEAAEVLFLMERLGG
jgi:tetratricopeptide (TPR) repeat protein